MPRYDANDVNETDRVEENEQYRVRLGTFKEWKGKVCGKRLAEAGFIYTGFSDRVVCRICHIRISNWKNDAEPFKLHQNFSPTCIFVLRNTSGAISMQRNIMVKYPEYSNFTSRCDSFTSWPLTWVAHIPKIMAKSGFFYIGSADRVRCFSCGLEWRNWAVEDNPVDVHIKNAKDCEFVIQVDGESIKQEIQELIKLMFEYDDYNFTEIVEENSTAQIVFTNGGLHCDVPSEEVNSTGPRSVNEADVDKYPVYADLQARLESFVAWPLNWIAHTPEMMARSGFFYIGSADRVMCFSCGIMWRDWTVEDFPPDVHEKYSANCKFVAHLDINSIIREIGELQQLMEYDDYNCTERFDLKATVARNFKAERFCCDIHLEHIPSTAEDTTEGNGGSKSTTKLNTDKYPQYASLQARLDTFTAWPLTTVAHTPEMMARSGFFYIGSADRVMCFSCGLGWRDWNEEENPADVHRINSEDCQFVGQLDDESIKQDIEELEKLLEFDDYNFTEVFNRRSTTDSVFTEECTFCDIHRSSFVGCCPAKSTGQ